MTTWISLKRIILFTDLKHHPVNDIHCQGTYLTNSFRKNGSAEYTKENDRKYSQIPT